jgi:hypothetical protein
LGAAKTVNGQNNETKTTPDCSDSAMRLSLGNYEFKKHEPTQLPLAEGGRNDAGVANGLSFFPARV